MSMTKTHKVRRSGGKDAARLAIGAYLQSLDVLPDNASQAGPRPLWHQPRPDEWTIGLVGSAQQSIDVELSLGEYTLQFMSFFMRKPDENVAEVNRLLLRRNLELSTVRFGIDEFGDIYLRADLPVAGVIEDELDRTIGIFVIVYRVLQGIGQPSRCRNGVSLSYDR